MSEEIAFSDFERLSVILPAFNEASVIAGVVSSIRKVTHDDAEIIVVDDGSGDATASEAEQAGATVIRHPYNKGNGAAIKTGARAATRDLVVFIDADGQHDPADIPRLAAMLKDYDLVIGARKKGSKGGWHRSAANRGYNWLASWLSRHRIEDLTSGFRAFRRELLLKFLPLFPNRYSYPSTSTLAFIAGGYSVGYCPILARKRVGKSKLRILRDGFKFLNIILKIVVLFNPMRVFLPASIISFLAGLFLTGFSIANLGRLFIPNGAIICFTTAVVIFMLGLVSQQIAALRIENIEKADSKRLKGD